MALQRIWIPSPCYHSRSTSGVRLIVIHTAEGARTIEDLGHFFQNYNNQVSSHTGADDKRGKIGEYVSRSNASWTCANYNNAAVQIEMCGFASWSTNEWRNNHDNMLRNCADWIREESAKFGIPITKLSAGAAQGSGRGVCQHRDLGAGGGGHTDCGNGFPIDYVLDLARGSGTAAPSGGYNQALEDSMIQLVFAPGSSSTAPAACLNWTNYYADGKGELVFSCTEVCDIRVDLMGEGPTQSRTLGYENRRQAVAIPQGCKIATVRRDSGTFPICCTLYHP